MRAAPRSTTASRTFDTADVYANTAAETVLGEALKGERRESLEIFTKVYWPTGPRGKNDTGLSRKHIMESINGSLSGCRPTTSTSTRRTATTRRPRSRRRCRPSPTSYGQGKALYIGVSEWTADQIRDGPRAREGARHPADLHPAAVLRCSGASSRRRSCPTCRELGISQIVWSPIAQGVLTGKYQPGQAPPEGSRATDDKGGANMIKRLHERRGARPRVQELEPVAKELDLTMAQLAVAWVLQNDNVAAALVGASRPEQVSENVKAAGVTIPPELMTRIDDALGDVVERDPSKTASQTPETRVV